MRTRQKHVATDTWRSLGCRTTPLEHWSKRKPTVESRCAKQQTKKQSLKKIGKKVLKLEHGNEAQSIYINGHNSVVSERN